MTNGLSEIFGLSGRIAIVTGAATGIGAGIARALSIAGAHVVIADRDEVAANEQVGLLNADGLSASATVIDIAMEGSVVDGVRSVVRDIGAPWILVNNAGVQDRRMLLDTSVDDWDRIHAVNARGGFLMLREAAKAMIEAGNGGRIVNIASLGVRHPMIDGLTAYSSSKGAMIALTQNAAFELAEHRITVNAVLPGGVTTNAIHTSTGPEPRGPGMRGAPLGQCEPADMGAAVLYLASPGARHVTNANLSVDAGFLLG